MSTTLLHTHDDPSPLPRCRLKQQPKMLCTLPQACLKSHWPTSSRVISTGPSTTHVPLVALYMTSTASKCQSHKNEGKPCPAHMGRRIMDTPQKINNRSHGCWMLLVYLVYPKYLCSLNCPGGYGKNTSQTLSNGRQQQQQPTKTPGPWVKTGECPTK